MADYTLGLVKQIIVHRSRLLEKTGTLSQPCSLPPSLEYKLSELATYTISIAKQGVPTRGRTGSSYRSVSRSRSTVRISQVLGKWHELWILQSVPAIFTIHPMSAIFVAILNFEVK